MPMNSESDVSNSNAKRIECGLDTRSLWSTLFGFGPLLALTAAIIGSIIGSVPCNSPLDNDVFLIDCDQRNRFIHHLIHIAWIFFILILLFSGIVTLFFLGYFRFEVPARSTDSAAAGATAEYVGSAIASASTGPYIWLYECQHNHINYLCFPPYCTPGGLRSRLFPSVERTTSEIEIEVIDSCPEVEAEDRDNTFTSHDRLCIPSPKSQKSPSCKTSPTETALSPEEESYEVPNNRLYRTTNSTNNPLDLILQSPYLPLPHFAKQSIEERQYDWNTLGGSKCSWKKNSLATEKELESASQSSSFPQSEGEHFGKLEPIMTTQQNTEFTPPNSANVHVQRANPAGKPIPQAVLVYHESAHSIVFRDHLRRQQSAIRRTSIKMENSNLPGPDQQMRRHSMPVQTQKQNTQPLTDSTTPATISEAPETDVGYESGGSRGSTSSNRSNRSNRSSHSARSVGENSSVASRGLLKPMKKRASCVASMQPVVIANFQPVIEPLESLDLNSSHEFGPLLDADPFKEGVNLEMSDAESEVVDLLKNEQAVVKTIRNADWTAFLQKFKPSEEGGTGTHQTQNESNAMRSGDYPYNSFVSSTSILPSCAKKMRCFGSTKEYAIGVVFALPQAFPDDASEDDAVKRTRAWSWPSGYSAKTEFNIDDHGNLINGREEALVPLSGLRKMNHSYLYDKDYIVGGRMVKGGLTTIPYNECYIRVGALGRISSGVDVATGNKCDDADGSGRSFDNGIGLPVALFVRELDYGHLVRLLRTRARYAAIFGSDAARDIPLLYITPQHGVRVFTHDLQVQVFKKMSLELNPFQNPSLAHRTSIDNNTSEPHLQQKLEELLDLDDDKMKQVLTPEEMARIAGGFGATDESVANLLEQAMQRDTLQEKNQPGHNLQDVVNEGLAFALRANDYHTSRQLLILYTLVASKRRNTKQILLQSDQAYLSDSSRALASSNKLRDEEKNNEKKGSKERHLSKDETALGEHYVPPPPPPPPLDTDRLRSATNSDGLLAVLGAAQVLRAMQDGSAKRRVKESIDSIEKWIENGEQSVAFRVASWRDQRAAQGDLKIAMENDSNFMAFISNKAISNRKKFAKQLRHAAAVTDFDSSQVLKAIHSVLSQMRSPCLRLELLQYILCLDNRYSVAHVTRSVELAATCLNLSESDDNKLLE